MNPTLKDQWYTEAWAADEDKKSWIPTVTKLVKELWLEEYKGKFSATTKTALRSSTAPRKEKAFAAVKNHKRLKLHHNVPPEEPSIDLLEEFLKTNVIHLAWRRRAF